MGRIAGLSAEDVRARLLAAGVVLLGFDRESTPDGGISIADLRVRDIASAAGVSTGAFYGHWTGLADYQGDLAQHLVRTIDTYTPAAGLLAAAVSKMRTIESGLERLAALDLEILLRQHRLFWTEVELIISGSGSEPLRNAAAEGYRNVDELFGGVYDQLLRRFGLRFAEPWNAAKAYAVIGAMLEGVMLRLLVDDASGWARSRRESGLFAKAVRHFVMSVAVPID